MAIYKSFEMIEKLLHLEKNLYSVKSLMHLEESFNVDYFDVDNQSVFVDHLFKNKYEIIFAKLGLHFNQEVFLLQPGLKYIITPTTGLNHIDLQNAEKRNIQVISLKTETVFLKNVLSTAEHTWGLLLALIRNIPSAFQDVRDGYWRRSPFMANELDGKTLGIIGYGRLGKQVAKYGKAFNMNVIAYDISEEAFSEPQGKAVDLRSLLLKSDIVSLHIPFNEANRKFIDQNKFNLMKDTSVFINTSRGEVVNEDDLLRSLQNNIIKGAAVDVLDSDSSWDGKSPSNKLINYSKDYENLIITPHIGGYGADSIQKTRAFIMEKFLKNYLQ
jgi:D-3-phosphoglycerate dehydrogenase / 2-oxoglutarate reductase